MKEKKAKDKKNKSMEEVSKDYEKFIAGKELDPNGAKKFDTVLKKAAKQRDSK